MPLLIDTHAHLNFPDYADDRGAVLERARRAGVETVVCIGMLPQGAREALALAREHPGAIYASAGVHPYDAALLDDAMLEELADLLRAPEMRLVGEIGIDTVKAEVSLAIQEQSFERQLELARRLDLPVSIHSRGAFPICQRLIRRVFPGGWKGFAHCFSDGVDEARGWRELGLVVSFAGQITFKNKSCDPIRAAARALGPGDVVVETDCPFLSPTPYRGQRNEPARGARDRAGLGRAVGDARRRGLRPHQPERPAGTRSLAPRRAGRARPGASGSAGRGAAGVPPDPERGRSPAEAKRERAVTRTRADPAPWSDRGGSAPAPEPKRIRPGSRSDKIAARGACGPDRVRSHPPEIARARRWWWRGKRPTSPTTREAPPARGGFPAGSPPSPAAPAAWAGPPRCASSKRERG